MNVTVSQVNAYVKRVLDNDEVLSDITVTGEISGLKMHSSGHIYFSLKDESATIRCAFFKPHSLKITFKPEDGMRVRAHGRITLYERDGAYQLNVTELFEDGTGKAYRDFIELKERLEKEGLFDEDKKKPIPEFVRKIGVATSPTGAVIRDIMNVTFRRCPGMQIVLAPVSVQGDDAERSICTGLKLLDELDDVDVIIVGRGGGSMEDLWCFNSEEVARTIFACKKPVISAVGHETDFTIADFVADLRAPTPSAAAELAVFDWYETQTELNAKARYMLSDILRKLSEAKTTVANAEKVFMHPEMLTEGSWQRLDTLSSELANKMDKKFTSAKNDLQILAEKTDAMNPLKVLMRGYSIATKSNGIPIKDASNLKCGENIKIKFSSGEADAEIKEIR